MNNQLHENERRTTGIKPGAVVQIDPEHDPVFGGCFLLVEEVRRWGVQGFVEVPGKGRAYYRCPYEALAYVGNAEWVPENLREVLEAQNGCQSRRPVA